MDYSNGLKMKMVTIIFAIFFTLSGRTQTTDEWLNQKKTKLKYIEQQIAALQVYGDYLKQGYDIVQKGWSLVDDIKHGDFDLHDNYFNSLRAIKEPIEYYSKVDSIRSLQLQILQLNDAINKFTQDNENIQSQEKEYISKVMSNLLTKCAENLDQLTTLTTNGSVEMKDDERLQRLDELYADMQDKYVFSQYFENSVKTLALARVKNVNDVNTSKLLYGIK